MKVGFAFADPLRMPVTGVTPEAAYADALPLSGTRGQEYAERRGIPVGIAEALGVRFAGDFAGRPAVVVPLRDREGRLASVHGRYLHLSRGMSKMLTVGTGGGAIFFETAWKDDPLILVEGLFDVLSLAVSGWRSVATIGRPIPWLPEVAKGRVVWAAFDNGRSGEANAEFYRHRLKESELRRLQPPLNCKDWNTALVKRGPAAISRWVGERVQA